MLSGSLGTILRPIIGTLVIVLVAAGCSEPDSPPVFPADAAELAIAQAAQGFPAMSRDVTHNHVSDDGEVETIRTLVVPVRFDTQRISDELGESFLVTDERPSDGSYWQVDGTSQLNGSDGSTIYKVTLSTNNDQVYFAGSQFFGIDKDGLVVAVEPPPGITPTTAVS